MRYNLKKENSTKPERIVYEVLKELKLPFRHRWIIAGREVDFIVGKLAIEIDGHEQDIEKNNILVGLGYTPVHLLNQEINRKNIINLLKDYENTTKSKRIG